MEDKVTLLEVLDRAAEKVGTRFADEPELERSLRWTIAKTYHGLASWEKAEAQLRAVLDAARQRDPRSAETYQAQGELAHILRHRGRRDAEVLEMAEAAAKGLERTLGPDHPDTLATLNNLAAAYQAVGKLPEAIALLERVRDARIAKLGPDHPDTLTTLNNLAAAYQAAGKLPEAIALLERVRDAQIAKLGPDHPDTLTTLNNLAVAYQAAGKLPEAIALYERVRDAQIAKLGPDHPDTLTTLNNLAAAYQAAGKLPEAIALFERVRDARIAKLGPDHPDTLTTLNNLAAAYWRTNQLDKSVPLFEDVLKRQEAKLGRQHPNTQLTVANLGVNYKDAGRLKEAIPLLEEAHQAAKRFPTLRWVADPLIDAYAKAGENAKLADLVQEQLRRGSKSAAQGQPRTGRPARPDRSEPPPAEEMDRGRAAPPRVPGHPREVAARRLVHLQHEVAARRGLAGPEEIRRGRTALAEGLRGNEAAGEDDPAARRRSASPKPSTGSSNSTPPRTSRTKSRSGKPSGRSIRPQPTPPGGEEVTSTDCSREGPATRPSRLNAYGLRSRSLARMPEPAGPIWEQNGNRTGDISPMRLQCTCVRQYRNCLAIKAFKYHRNVFPIRTSNGRRTGLKIRRRCSVRSVLTNSRKYACSAAHKSVREPGHRRSADRFASQIRPFVRTPVAACRTGLGLAVALSHRLELALGFTSRF